MEKVINGRLLCDLELLLNGAFNPLTGFLGSKDYNNVVENLRLASGEVWPIPIVYTIDDSEVEEYSKHKSIILKDKTNLPLARFHIEEIYKPNLEKECEGVYGTNDDNHPYVKIIKSRPNVHYIGGKVEKLNLPAHFDFNSLRLTPDQVKKIKEERGIKNLVGFQTRNPMHKCHYELVKYALRQVNQPDTAALIHPVVGITQECDIDYYSRVKCYKKIMNHFSDKEGILSLLPLSMRMGGPREALLHALIRKNYGCTHFIVGRDHAGPSYKTKEGKKFYGDYDAHELLGSLKEEIGIQVIVAKAIMYVKELGEYRCEDELKGDETCMHISGTEQRRLLRAGQDIPEWFSFPDVVSELKQVYKPNNKKGFCIYLIGLSGAGKSLLASSLNEALNEKLSGRAITILDGDVIRQNISKGLGFSKEDRSTNVQRIGYIASEIVKHGGVCIAANIAPYDSDRLINRKSVEETGGYFEIHVDTSLAKCEERDIKGLYKKAREGIIKEFTGISDPFEKPSKADLILDNSNIEQLGTNVDKIIDLLKKDGYL